MSLSQAKGSPETFAQVRAIIDARILAWRAVCERKLEARREAASMLAEECALPECACRDCRPRRRGVLSNLTAKLARLPENLPVPSVEPRLPNLHAANLSFAARLIIGIRDKFDGDAPKAYSAARISRQAYSQIVGDETRPVSKRTAVRFAFALKSTPEEARLLLKSAGYAFSNSLTEDFILQACLEVNPPIWDLDAVNQLLREYRVDFQY